MAPYAAIDIGSNSIRLQIADAVPQPGRLPDLRTVAERRSVTRLGEGVFHKPFKIRRKAMEETWSILGDIAALCNRLGVKARRAVATSAVRDARNRVDFVDRAEGILGVPVEVISGPEEANLVHLGVHTRWPGPIDARSLVVDLGGGSAQFVHGVTAGVTERLSRPLGAVRLRELFLEHDPPKKRELRRMHDYIDAKLALVTNQFHATSIRRVIVTSGTAAAVTRAVHGIDRKSRANADGKRVSASGVRSLYDQLSSLDVDERREIEGIGSRRAEVIVPGVAVLSRILEVFGLRHFWYTTAGVRDGIIADLAMNAGRRQGVHEEHFHVFVCYNQADRQSVLEIADRLRDRGIVPWIDDEQIQPGSVWQDTLAEQIGTIRSAAVFIGPRGIGSWQRAEVDRFLNEFRSRKCPVIPVILPQTDRDPDLPLFLGSMKAVDFRRTKPDPLEALIWGITGKRSAAALRQ